MTSSETMFGAGELPELPDAYSNVFPVDIEVAGRPLRVLVHLALVEGRVTCVGIDIRSFTYPADEHPPAETQSIRPADGQWTEITTPLIRGVRIAEVISEAAAQWGDRARNMFDELVAQGRVQILMPNADEVREGYLEHVDELHRPPQGKRRGRKPVLSDEVLRDIVAPSYRAAPRKPVQAVRAALGESVPIYKGDVSNDIARKAVAAARARGFIPPAKRSPRQHGGQS